MYIPKPAISQMLKYPDAMQLRETQFRRVLRNVGSADGIIMASIMASHISKKLRVDINQD